MTLDQRKNELINQIASLDNEALLIHMEELIHEASSGVPSTIIKLLDQSSKSNSLTEHTSARDLLR